MHLCQHDDDDDDNIDLGMGCTLTAVPRSTQPSTVCRLVNEYQPYG